MWVIKRSGEREQFDPGKARAAVMRAGVGAGEADEIVERLIPQLYDGITTEEIYRRIHQSLERGEAARYGLKKALLRLGPEGWHFETFVGRLFAAEGYSVRVRQILEGRCVSHEVDAVAEKAGEKVMVECKFHNALGIKCAIQCALSAQSRYLDLKEGHGIASACLVTNTRFTSDVVRYASCTGMRLLSWRWPEEAGIERLVEKHRLYPITVLDLGRHDLSVLLDNDIILVGEMLERADVVARLLTRPSADKALRMAADAMH
ncbi:MAG: restriction endonuclease [Methanomassiliicoccales archaeon]|nr:restriction endonuclease [Methanomassiliicoccales archaeon]